MKNDEITKDIEIEYNALKAEQRQRINTRDNMLYLQIVSIVGLATIYKNFSLHGIALLQPFVSIVLGWKYYINDLKVSEIAAYFRKMATDKKIFRFELDVRNSNWRSERKYFELLLKISIFVAPIIIISLYSIIQIKSNTAIRIVSSIYFILGWILMAFLISERDT